MKFETKLDARQYFKGLARQPLDFHHALGELIDNSLSARHPKQHGEGYLPTLVEVTVEELERTCIVQVADHGTGIDKETLTTRVFNPGGQGAQLGAMNEHGFGLKNALALLTGGNETNFLLITRNAANPKDTFLSVSGPLSVEMELDPAAPREAWAEDLHHLADVEESGTKIRVEVATRYVNTLYRRAVNFDTLMRRLGEHLGVIYRQYIDAGNEIRLRYRPLNAEWIHKSIPAIPVPYQEGDKHTTTKSISVGGKEYQFTYTRGVLDYTVKDADAEGEHGWPYPLKIYYQGSNARCGIDILVRSRVILSGQFESIWPNISKTVAFNRFVGELEIGADFRTTNNKTGLDPHSENWEELLRTIRQSEFRPEETTRSHSERSLRDDLIKVLEGTFTGAKVRRDRGVWGGGADVDIDLEAGRERRIYELKVVAARVLDVYQLQMAWDGLVEEGVDPTHGILIAKEVSQSVSDAVSAANARSDRNGRQYQFEAKTINDVLPEFAVQRLTKR